MEWTGIVLGYLLGSVPSAVWLGKAVYNTDVRDYGSRNAGATNTFRVLGWKLGVVVLLLDMLKGWAAIEVSRLVFGLPSQHILLVFTGAAAVAGHILPIMAGFRGGKGIATLAGISIALFPLTLVIVLGIFLLVLLTTNYVSLSSLVSAIALPLVSYFIEGNEKIQIIVFTLIIALIVPLTHHKNIKRLIRGTESKISFH
jgi:glycerol-3-phosphate acyltransferase PlsY